MKRGFTLLEILIAMGIMGLLGTLAVGGYRAMVVGMEKRGALQSVNFFIRAAYQRAQIDRQPTAIFFWNETLRGRTGDASEIVVGKAVAVRRSGRLSRVEGSLLVDEFADLNQTYMAEGVDMDGTGSKVALIELYPIDDLNAVVSSTDIKRSLVRTKVRAANETAIFLGGSKAGGGGDDAANEIPGYAFVVENMGGVTWRQGMAYGFEFQRLTLPNGYIFGDGFSSSENKPIVGAGTLVFDVGRNDNSGRNTGGVVGRSKIGVSRLRQVGETLEPESIGTSEPPDRGM